MKKINLAISALVLLSCSEVTCACEYTKIKRGENTYYSAGCQYEHSTEGERKLHSGELVIPEVPQEYKECRTEYTKLGLPFEPRAFFEKPMDYKLTYLKEQIISCKLIEWVDKKSWDAVSPLISSRSAFNPFEKGPYPSLIEEQFEKAVWEKLHEEYSTSFEDFQASLRSKLIPQDELWSAPLIVHFQESLLPRYKMHFNSEGFMQKAFKLPSEFEELVGIGKEPELFYERGNEIALFTRLFQES